MRKVFALLVLAAAIQLAAAQATYVFEEDQLTGPETVSVTGYYEIMLDNRSDDRYNFSVLRLGEGKTADDYRSALETLITAFQSGGDTAAGFAALREAASQIGSVSAEAGASGTAGLLLEPGGYLLSGQCGQCPPNQQIVAFTVENGPRAEAPEAEVRADMVDFHFGGVPTELTAGPKLWEIANTGEQGHVFILFKLAEGKALDDLTTWLATPESRNGPPPADLGEDVPAGAYLDPGGRYYETIDLAPGTYAVICPVPDPASGQPHYDLGMIQALTVK
jgi:uncharacterized cupredoxin-like copper-binding protein